MESEITEKQKRFCEEYVVDLNGKQAAIRAGYSEKTAKETASRLLTYVNVTEYIIELKLKISEKIQINHLDVLTQLKQWVELDVTETIGLSSKEIKELPKEIRTLITGFKKIIIGKKEIIELRFVSKEKAIEMINRHIGFYELDNTQSKATVTNLINLGVGEEPETDK